jgi:dihydrofolate reductase
LEKAAEAAAAAPEPEICIIGGGQIYAEVLARADRIWLTEVDAQIDGDTVFPDLDPADWAEAERRPCPPDARASHACSFVRLERRRP